MASRLKSVTARVGSGGAAGAGRREMLRRAQLIRVASRYGGLVMLIVLFLVFAATMSDTFLTDTNLQGVAANQAVPGLLAVALLLPLVAGEFDFSAGAVLGAAMVFMAILTGEKDISWQLAALVVLCGGALTGLINGLLVAKVGIHSFVATLAVSGIVSGAALWASNGEVLFENIPTGLTDAGTKFLWEIPLPVVYLLCVAALVWYVLRATPWGRYQEAVGKGRRAATLSGVPVNRQVITGFVAGGALAAVAGIVNIAQLGSAPPNLGPPLLLSAYAAAFLGSTMFRPGFPNIPGTIVAVFLIAIAINGLELAGVSSFIEPILTGIVLILAVSLSRLEALTILKRSSAAPGAREPDEV
jgi:ribose transport system permease protein